MDRYALLSTRMERIARIISSRFDVRVRMRGANAFVDLRTREITLPAVESSPLPAYAWEGFLDHEVAHVLYTDASIVDDIVTLEPVEKQIWNIIEDAYIERRMGSDYPGARQHLADLRDLIQGETERKIATGQETAALTKIGHALMNHAHERGHLDFTTDADVGALYVELLPLFERAPKCMSSRECLRLAKRIYAKLRGIAEGESTQGDEGSVPSPEAMEIAAQCVQGRDEDEPVLDIESRINRMYEEHAVAVGRPGERENTGPSEYLVYTTEHDREITFTPEERSEMASTYAAIRSHVQSYVGAIARRLELDLASVRDAYLVGGQRKGRRLDAPRVGAWLLGGEDSRFYKRYQQDEGLDTAVTLLMDMSGSMGVASKTGTAVTSKSDLARITASAFHEALTRAEIPHEVLGFDSGSTRSQIDVCSIPNADIYSRITEICDRYVLVPFGQSDGRAIAHINGRNSNRDGESVLWAAKRLAKRPERRHVLIVCSDGQPRGARYHRTEKEYLKQVVRQVIESGIEVYAIGVQSTAVEDYYPTHAVLEDADELPGMILRVLSKALMGQRGMRS